MGINSKILVIGATGQLGRLCMDAFGRSGYEVFGSSSSQSPSNSMIRLDLAKKGMGRDLILKLRPDVCLISGAMTDVEGCESSPERAFRINTEAPGEIAEAARDFSCRVVYLSTEYIFDGENGPYSETEAPNALNIYGKTKLEGEHRVLCCSDQNLIVRTTVVYSFHEGGKNFMMQLLKRLSSSEKMNVPIDQISSPTYAPDLAMALEGLVSKKVSGIVNAVGPDILSRRDFAIRAAKILGFDESLIQGVLTSNLNQKASRPLRAGLLNDKLKAILGDVMGGVDAGVAAFARAAANI
jgi:dTDP-4-dehydrorhamnose reductase